jgi:type I restriction enzyme M protein
MIISQIMRGKYQDVILPLTGLRRIDEILEPTKEEVLTTYSEFEAPPPHLRTSSHTGRK